MSDFFEIDFLSVNSKKSGDAISLRYELNGKTFIHVVDGGYQNTGNDLVAHIKRYYSSPNRIDHVIATHPDGDHTCGLQAVLENFEIGKLWMLRPWLYAKELIDRFSRFTSIEGLTKRLKETYPYIATLEKIAMSKEIPIHEPFQGVKIGAFTIMAPQKTRYLDLVVESDKTPEATDEKRFSFSEAFSEVLQRLVSYIKSIWGEEKFSSENTTAENEMSIVQYAELCSKRILLTGDAGRIALTEAADFTSSSGLTRLPGIDKFQVPHHGSRRNVNTEILNQWLGKPLPNPPSPEENKFEAIVSVSKEDKEHPRKAVIRAMIHRGASVFNTHKTLCVSANAPKRDGWSSAQSEPYPEEQEE